MARDPVCGMNVRDDRKESLRSEFRGQNYFFCSDKCQKEFDRSPQNFVRDNDNRNQDVRNDLRNDNRDNNRNQRQGNRNDLRDDRRPR
ncbi:MAG: YHS domain-containing protein [Bacillota bacterium]